MREEEGTPKLGICSAEQTDGETKIGLGTDRIIDSIRKSTKAIDEFSEQLSDGILEIQASGIRLVMRIPRSKRSIIHSPPGALARSIMSFLFPKKAFDEIFAQAITDMRQEHAEALANGGLWKARWIVIRDHLGICLTVVAYLSATAMKKAAGIWKMIP